MQKYVVVLVGHGKDQVQAVKDLEAFLGGDSESFVSWYDLLSYFTNWGYFFSQPRNFFTSLSTCRFAFKLRS